MAQIFNFIDFSEIVFRIKLASFFLSFAFLSLIVYFMVKFNKLIQLKISIAKLLVPPESAHGGALQSKWEEIRRHSESHQEAEWKLAVIEADKLVDDILKSANYSGETMGERLMSIERGQLQTLDGLWEAHKIRNKLIHDTNYFLRYAEARKAVQLYEKTLQELEAI